MRTIELTDGNDRVLTLEIESGSNDVIVCCSDPDDEDVTIFIAKGQARPLAAFAKGIGQIWDKK